MCVWGSQPITAALHIEQERALTAYKIVLWNPRTKTVHSPTRKTVWRFGRMSAKDSPLLVLRDSGVYCYKTLAGARSRASAAPRHIIVELRIWGDIARYKRNDDGWQLAIPAGYRAEHAQIVAIHPYTRTYASAYTELGRIATITSMRKRFTSLPVVCTHKVLWRRDACSHCGAPIEAAA